MELEVVTDPFRVETTRFRIQPEGGGNGNSVTNPKPNSRVIRRCQNFWVGSWSGNGLEILFVDWIRPERLGWFLQFGTDLGIFF